MRDAASAAAMSDPDMNRWFRRRWVEPLELHRRCSLEVPAIDDDLALTGLALLEEWRQQGQAWGRP